MNVSNSTDTDINTTTSTSYDDNIRQDIDNLYDNEIIPDNNFEDGFEIQKS